MQCDFSYKHYQDLLESVLKAGFKITNFRDFEKNKKNSKLIILRHDVDIDLKKALEFAKIETSLKVKSTYFIRVHGEYYFPSSEEGLSILQKIKALDHEIGLHSEARSLSKLWSLNQIDIFLQEKKFLEEILQIDIESAAEHGDLARPKGYWKDHFFTKVKKGNVGIKNFPQDIKYAKFKYLSDSLKRWREGCLCQNLEKYNKIQVAIHADWWGK